jgi:putative transport protein
MTQCNVSRIQKKSKTSIVGASTILDEGDIVHAIGIEKALQKFELVIGPKSDSTFSLNTIPDATSKRVIVTNKEIIGKRIAAVPQLTRFQTIVTRIRRSGIDISPSRSTRFRYGDKITIVFPRIYKKEVYNLVGGTPQSSIDFFPIALSIVLGILIGQISIPITSTLTIAPGYTGGILITTLLLGQLDKTGPLLWSIAGSTNQFLRQIGLLFFLSAVGTKSGATIVAGINHYGVKFFFFGIVLTIIPMIIGTLFSKYVLKLNILQIFGVLSAGMTSGPSLVAVNEITTSNIPDRVYSVAFPVALIFTIMISQFLALTL